MSNALSARSHLIFAVMALTLGFMLLATLSLGELRAERAEAAPIIAVGADDLEIALAAAPATVALRGPAAVWIVTGRDCGACAAIERRELAALAGLGVSARVIVAEEKPEIAAALRANDLEFTPPLVFWRHGAEWRAAIGDDPRALAQMRRDVALGSTS